MPATRATATIETSLRYVFACSAFVANACVRDAGLMAWLASDAGRLLEDLDVATCMANVDAATLPGTADDAQFMAALRGIPPPAPRAHRLAGPRGACADRYRPARAVCGWPTPASLRPAGTRRPCSASATACRATRDGAEIPLLVLGMGKLGGGELNFSSDIDLVFAFAEHGETTGPRPLEHEEFFTRAGKRLAQLLGTPTDDGFVYRVDLRLRPFGDSGPVAVSFDAIEDYLQQHGRDWERYAYVKARPVFGAGAGFDELYRNVLRPFVYRRYLDFGVFESLRGMKELIAREVERRELQQNVKLGPGGIREIEFIVQAFQLLRGGSNPRLQTRSLLEALPQLAGQKLLPGEAVGRPAGRLPFPATRREPPAGVERRADPRAARGRARPGAARARDGRAGLDVAAGASSTITVTA